MGNSVIDRPFRSGNSIAATIMDSAKFLKAQFPVFLISKVLGLAPFAVKVDANGKLESVRVSVPWFCYSIVIYCGYLYAFSIAYEVSVQVPMARSYPFISIVGHLLHIFLALIIFNACYIVNVIKANQFTSITQAIMDVDVELLALGSPVCELIDYRKGLTRKWQIFAVNTTFFIFMTLFDYFIFRDLYGNFIYIMCFTYILPYFLSSVMEMQFMNITNLVYERFEVINQFLLHIAAVNENHTKGTDAPEVEVLVSAKSTNKTDKAETPKKEFLKEPSSYGFDQNLHLKLHEIFRVHDRLCDLAEELNECYSLQLVCCITSVFILLIFGFFFETKVVFWAWGGATKLMLISTSYLLWGVIASIVIYIVLFLCTAVRDSANRSALIIHKILQMKPAFMLNDETYYNKMKSFTLQILHRKNILHFNGLGLFRLDYTFIFSVTSAATSYLIVLLQFDLSNELKEFSSSKFY